MENQEQGESVLFRYVRQDIALLNDLLFDYITRHSKDDPAFEVPDRFILVSAFACVFQDLKLVSGKHYLITSMDEKNKKVCLLVRRHHWLAWRDDYHIIDLLPVDGTFGICAPQAIIQKPNQKNFVSQPNLYPKRWEEKQKNEFNNDLSDLIEVLEKLKQKVPL